MTRVDVADCVAWAEAYDGPPFHALLCDPPYELGFMGRAWDRSGVAFNPDTWRALARVLHPGAFGMAFASSRGWHRLAVAIEDAGLTIHPSIFGWAFGSGFPKATRIVDAPDFTGHRYGLQALKPALEPIIVFQKPYAGRPVDSITATGAGALNVDGGRVPTGDNLNGGTYCGESRPGTVDVFASTNSMRNGAGAFVQPAGRWPANLVVCHTPDCVRVGERRVRGTNAKTPGGGAGLYDRGSTFAGSQTAHRDADGLETVAAYACAPGCPVAALGAQSGERASGARVPGARTNGVHPYGFAGGVACSADTGTAARFYHNPDYALDIAERLAAAEPVRYVAKASRRERNAGCEGLPEMSGADKTGRVEGSIGLVGDPSNKGQTANPYANGAAARNPHPTVKPLALARHLATLLLPPDAYAPRRLFVPFAGSGSECIGGMLAGWDEVVGVELSDEYAEIARARLAWWEASRDAAPSPRATTGQDWIAAGVRGGNRKRGAYGAFASDDGRFIDRAAPPPRGADLTQLPLAVNE